MLFLSKEAFPESRFFCFWLLISEDEHLEDFSNHFSLKACGFLDFDGLLLSSDSIDGRNDSSQDKTGHYGVHFFERFFVKFFLFRKHEYEWFRKD